MSDPEKLDYIIATETQRSELRAMDESHWRLDYIKEASAQLEQLKGDNERLLLFSQGRGMVSEADNFEEVAILVCGLHDRVDQLRAARDEMREALEHIEDITRDPFKRWYDLDIAELAAAVLVKYPGGEK
jgi:hypothetical protein